MTVPILTEIKSISAAGYEGDRCDGAGLDNYREQVVVNVGQREFAYRRVQW